MKVLIDLGSNMGQGLKKLIEIYKPDQSWRIECFEPSPIAYRELVKAVLVIPLPISCNKVAVGIEDKVIDFYIEDKPEETIRFVGDGATIIEPDKWMPSVENPERTYKKIQVSCIDFPKWLQENFTKEDRIVLKMDVEGSEYDILQRMIELDLFTMIDELYIEWHSHLILSPERDKVSMDMIEAEVKQIMGGDLHPW